MTTFVSEAIETADDLYCQLRDTVEWVDGIKSRSGKTRKAKQIQMDDPLVESLMPYIRTCLEKLNQGDVYALFGLYLNYYQDGQMYTPNHSHKDTQQLVISLGSCRTLVVGKKEYRMKSGDCVLFGSSTHGVPREPEVKEGRISIATFMSKCS